MRGEGDLVTKRIAALGLLVADLLLTGASVSCKDECSGVYHCPNMSVDSQILVPDGLSSPLVSLTATPPCRTNFLPGDHEEMLVVRFMEEPLPPVPSCTVHGRLADGTELTGSAPLESLPCCGVRMAALTVMLQPVDGSIN